MSLMHRAVRTVARGRYRVVDDLLTTPRPDDAPSAHAPGTDPDRVLVFGNGPAVGWGVRSHDLALPGHLARRLSALTGRGADVDALADPHVTVATAHELAASRPLRGYDAVVVVLGMSDALQLLPGHRWSSHLCALLSQLEQATDPSCHLLVVGIQPPSSVQKFGAARGGAADQQAGVLNRLSADLCAGRERLHFLLPPVPSTHTARPAGDSEEALAASTATGSVPTLTGSTPTASRHLPPPSVMGIVFSCLITAVFMVGHYSFFTYIAPYLLRSTGIAESSLSVALFAFGIAGGVGLLLVGWFLGKRPRITIPVGMAVVVVAVLAMVALEGQPGPSLVAFVVWGVTFGALPPLFQTKMLQVAPSRLRDIASAFYTTGFNAGIGGGALIGALVLDGAGLDVLPLLYVVVAAVMLVVVLVTDAVLMRRSPR